MPFRRLHMFFGKAGRMSAGKGSAGTCNLCQATNHCSRFAPKEACLLRCAQVEILSEGDTVNELMILVGGMVEVLKPGSEAAEELTIDLDGFSSVRGTYTRSAPAGQSRIFRLSFHCSCLLLGAQEP
jgi:hypothetical protein